MKFLLNKANYDKEIEHKINFIIGSETELNDKVYSSPRAKELTSLTYEIIHFFKNFSTKSFYIENKEEFIKELNIFVNLIKTNSKNNSNQASNNLLSGIEKLYDYINKLISINIQYKGLINKLHKTIDDFNSGIDNIDSLIYIYESYAIPFQNEEKNQLIDYSEKIKQILILNFDNIVIIKEIISCITSIYNAINKIKKTTPKNSSFDKSTILNQNTIALLNNEKRIIFNNINLLKKHIDTPLKDKEKTIYTKINNLEEKVEKNIQKLEELHASFNNIQLDQQVHSDELIKLSKSFELINEIDTYKKNLKTNLNNILIELRQKNDDTIDDNNRKYESIFNELKSTNDNFLKTAKIKLNQLSNKKDELDIKYQNIMDKVTSYELSELYIDRANELKEETKNNFRIALLGGILGITSSGIIFYLTNGNSSSWDIFKNFLILLPIYGFASLLWHNYIKSRNLYEDYKFKSIVTSSMISTHNWITKGTEDINSDKLHDSTIFESLKTILRHPILNNEEPKEKNTDLSLIEKSIEIIKKVKEIPKDETKG